ncbi:APC family permease [Streptomyces sp. NPDC057621]|uniref:APC family permease n=1 Tax=Streptomyces sp. NPDC057621 TaxID=3346186 RepID=UPI003680D359
MTPLPGDRTSRSAQLTRDGELDARQAADDAYLEGLGYKPQLSRKLGHFSAFALQFGTIAPIGGIVFTFAVGLVAVGPAMFWPWLVAGGLQILIALCVAEACSAYPIAGGAYNIVSRLGGTFLGWQTGWWIELAHIFSLASSCIALVPVILSWFGASVGHWGLVGAAAGLILISTLINIASVRFSTRFVNAGVIATLTACVLVTVGVAVALAFGDAPVHSADYLFTTDGTVKGSLLLPLLYAALLPCIVLNGFDVSGNTSEETKDAARTVPRAMVRANLGSYGFGTVVILLLILAMGRVTDTLAGVQPVTFILDPVLGHGLAKIFEGLAVLGLFVSAVVLQLAGARVLWAQARDNKLPFGSRFSSLNKERVPAFAVWVTAGVAVLSTLWSSLYVVLIAMTVVLWVAGYGALLTVMWLGKLRGTVPTAAFRVRGWRVVFPLTIAWSVLLCVVLVHQNPRQVGVGLLIAFIAGIVVYALSPARRSGRRTAGPVSADPNPPTGHSL